ASSCSRSMFRPARSFRSSSRASTTVCSPSQCRERRVPLAKLLRHRGEELPRDGGVRLDERLEVPGGHAVATHVGERGDRGRAVGSGEKCDLTEVVAGADRADVVAVHRDVGLTLVDDEEAGAAGALLENDVAGGDVALAHGGGDLLEL